MERSDIQRKIEMIYSLFRGQKLWSIRFISYNCRVVSLQLFRLRANCGLQSCSGVFSSLLARSLLAPWLIRSWQISGLSSSQAVWRAVFPYLSGISTTSLSTASRSLTTPTCPGPAALKIKTLWLVGKQRKNLLRVESLSCLRHTPASIIGMETTLRP